MGLRYNKGKIVVLGTLEPPFYQGFRTGVPVVISTLYNRSHFKDHHYGVSLIFNIAHSTLLKNEWYVTDDEIDHEATAKIYKGKQV